MDERPSDRTHGTKSTLSSNFFDVGGESNSELAAALKRTISNAPTPGADTQAIAAEPVDYLINRDVRIVGIGKARTASIDIPISNGLVVFGGRLVPERTDLLERWKFRVNQVVSSGRGNLFLVDGQGCASAIGLVPGPRPGTVHVRRPRVTALDEETIAAVIRVTRMSPREGQVFTLLLAGLPPKQICEHLDTSLSTVRSQVKSVLAKTGHSGMRELVSAMACLPSVANATGPADETLFDPPVSEPAA